MFSPVPTWKNGLRDDLDPEDVYEPFRDLLADYLPMSLRELARKVEKDRTTVSKWKSGDLAPTVDQQRQVARTVRRELERMLDHLERVEEMNRAAETLAEAHQQHEGRWDEETRVALEEANDRIRDLLEEGP